MNFLEQFANSQGEYTKHLALFLDIKSNILANINEKSKKVREQIKVLVLFKKTQPFSTTFFIDNNIEIIC